MAKVLFFALALLILPVCGAKAQDAAAPAPVGTFAEIEGTVITGSQDAPAQAVAGQPVYMNQTIETGPGAKALILFIDETELTLGEDTRLTVDDYVFDDQDTADNRSAYSILNGSFVMVSGLIGKKENPDVKINTAYGSIGLRGTTVWGGALDDAYNIFVQEGKVAFSTERGSVTIGQGEGTSVTSRRAIPARAKQWGQEKIQRAVKTITLKNPGEAKARVARIKQQHGEMRNRHLQAMGRKPHMLEKKEQLQEKREEKIEQRQEHKQEMQLKREDMIEKREELKDMKRPADKPGPGEKNGMMEKPDMKQPEAPPVKKTEMKRSSASPETAADFEKLERNHLNNRAAAPARPVMQKQKQQQRPAR